MRYLFSLLFLVLIKGSTVYSQQKPAISLIPQPKETKLVTGSFKLSSKTPVIYSGQEGRIAAEFFTMYIFSNYGFKLPLTALAAAVLQRDPSFSKQMKKLELNLISFRLKTDLLN